ncbi:MAG: InlB B-repeat-containing protein [Christensenellaceae bacterium]|jgi:uncharacterized repeat protein (TIGR02543 family)|nr:InlB B-repeat-containing protein [Christensenellaceae bacterium]
MKHKTKLLVLVLTLIFLTLSFSSCTEKYDPIPYKNFTNYFETPYFECIILGDYVHVLGLTKYGMQLEEVVIPTWGPSDKSSVIGYYPGRILEYNFNKGNALKYFISDRTQFSEISNLINANVMLFSAFPDASKVRQYLALSGNVYVPEIAFNEYLTYFPSMQHPANVSFLYNYGSAPNKGYYWIDNLDDGQTIKTMPPSPLRTGYVFAGWYSDSTLKTKWDATAPKTYDTLNIYAKWIKL